MPRRKLAIPVWIWFAVEWFVLLFVFLKTTLWLVDHISGMSAAFICAAGFLLMLIFIYGIYAGKRIPTLWPRVIVQMTAGFVGALFGWLGILIGVLKGYWWITLIGLVAFSVEGEVLTRRNRREQAQREQAQREQISGQSDGEVGRYRIDFPKVAPGGQQCSA